MNADGRRCYVANCFNVAVLCIDLRLGEPPLTVKVCLCQECSDKLKERSKQVPS